MQRTLFRSVWSERFVVAAAILGILLSLAYLQGVRAQVPGRGLRLKVVGEDGKPVPGAKIVVKAESGLPSGMISVSSPWSAEAVTDDSGEGTVADVPMRPVAITVSAPNMATTLWRNAIVSNQSVTTLVVRPGHTLRGVLKSDKGKPLAGAVVVLQRADAFPVINPVYPEATTGADGSFEFPHTAESRYMLVPRIPAALGSWSVLPQTILVAAEDADKPVELTAKEGITLKGRMIGTPAGAESNRINPYVNVRMPVNMTVRSKVDMEGNFEITGIPPDSTGILITFETQDLYPHFTWENPPAGVVRKTEGNLGFDFTELKGGTYEGLKVEWVKFGKLRGKITDADGAPIERVGLIPMPLNNVYFSKADGTYEMRVPPMEKVNVRLIEEAQAMLVPTFTVEPAQIVEKDLTAQRLARLSMPPFQQVIIGTVTGPNGQAVEGAGVYLGNQTIHPDSFDLTSLLLRASNRTGQVGAQPTPAPRPTWTAVDRALAMVRSQVSGFTFDMLFEGKTDVWAFDGAGNFGILRDVKSGTRDVEIKLAPMPAGPLQFAGQVVDLEGKSVAGARMVLMGTDPRNARLSQLFAETRTDAQGQFKIELDFTRGSNPNVRLVCLPEKGALAWKWLPAVSESGLKIQLQPEATIKGRLLDRSGNPIARGQVQMLNLRHPAFGAVQFAMAITDVADPFAPTAVSDAEGKFTLGGFPEGSQVRLLIGSDEIPYTNTQTYSGLNGTKDIGDVPVANQKGLVFEGTVRNAQTNEAIAGATVTVEGALDMGPRRTAKSDANGRYRLAGVTSSNVGFMLVARVGEGAGALSGRLNPGTGMQQGDVKHGMDFSLQASLESRQKTWPAAGKAPRSVLVLEDMDTAPRGQPGKDTLSLVDGEGKVRVLANNLNLAKQSSFSHNFAVDAKDKSIWVCENFTGGKLLHFKADGTQDWEKSDSATYNAVALDPETARAWVVTSNSGEYAIQIIEADGTLVKTITLGALCSDVVYQPFDKSFWVAGISVRKLDKDGNFILQSAVGYTNTARRLMANAKDGSVWISEGVSGPNDELSSFLLQVSREGRPLRQVPTEVSAAFAVDIERDVIWSQTYRSELQRISLKDSASQSLPVMQGVNSSSSLTIDPTSGTVWAATTNGVYCIAPDGRLCWSIPTKAETTKWVVVMP